MMSAKNWGSLLAVLLFLCLAVPATAQEAEEDALALVPLSWTDFPCETVPPKCPEAVGFLQQLLGLFPDSVIDLGFDERIDIDSGGICDELYIEAGGSFTLPTAGLAAELFMIRDEADPYYNDVAVGVQLWYLDIQADLTLKGRDCIGFIDFTIPFSGQVWADTILWQARYGVWLDTVANKVQLSDDFSEVGLQTFYFSAFGEPWDTFAYPFVFLFVRDALDNLLIAENGLAFNLVEGIMDGLYKAQPCGCMMVPSGYYEDAGKLKGHIALNMLPYLLPVGLVGLLRRRIKG